MVSILVFSPLIVLTRTIEDEWRDDMELGATELFLATGNAQYATDAGTQL